MDTSIATLTPSWVRALRAANRSERTIDSYMLATGQLEDWLTAEGHSTAVEAITTEHVRGYLASVVATRASATARQRYASLKQFFRWLEAEGEIDTTPMARVTPPKVVEQPPAILTDDELRALLKACARDKTFESRRDEAVVRLFVDTGMRLGELVGLKLSDVDLDLQVAIVTGKGSKVRSAPFGAKTAQALDRYVRARRGHPSADEPWFWLGAKGRLKQSGIEQLLVRRARDAGMGRVNPHRFRHTFAHRWLSAGGNETDLQRIAGWSSPQMLRRYGASAADQRARDAHRRLGLGDDL